MQRHPSLHQLLVAPPQQLGPQQPHGQMVAMPHAPPAQLSYGSIPPGMAQSQRFTGGIVQHQPGSQMFSPPDFTAPSYPSLTGGPSGGNMGGVHPLAALAAALGIGLSGPPGLPPHPTGANGQLGQVPAGALGGGQRDVGSGYLGKTGVPVLPGQTHSPASSGAGYLSHGGAPTPDAGRSTGGGFLGPTGAPQAGLAAALASVGKRGVYNV